MFINPGSQTELGNEPVSGRAEVGEFFTLKASSEIRKHLQKRYDRLVAVETLVSVLEALNGRKDKNIFVTDEAYEHLKREIAGVPGRKQPRNVVKKRNATGLHIIEMSN